MADPISSALAPLRSQTPNIPASPLVQQSTPIVPCTVHLETLYHHSPMGSSAIHEFWPPRTIHSYPTSDLRSSALRKPCIAVNPFTSQPAQSSTNTTLSHDQPTTTEYSIPLRREIEPGVWSDGTDRVLSATYPAVQDFLATARRTLTLPLPPSELVFVIAALEVFYHWNDPVHWMFWNDEKKTATAAVVNRIALRTPQLIRSKVAWNGEAEYLFILSSLHGSSSLPVDKDWFHVLNPAKAPSAPMNLRKRKAQPIEQNETLGEEDVSEIEGSRPKRPKTRSTRLVKLTNPFTPENTKPITTDCSPSEGSPISSAISLSPQDNIASPNPDADISLSAKTKTSRQRPNARQESSTPDPSLLPRAGSALLAPASATVGLNIPAPSYTRKRNRSISQTSSQTTLVADVERRSVSVLSNITAVEAHIGNGADKAMKDDQHASDSEEEKEGMVTRGRANKTRTPVQGKGATRPVKPRAKRRTMKS
ncbi:hypothetical protein DXG01_012192 [Tephrocybe rancida]|nr:hypothetical protein DXG01_012192 [Tephrocybe rancida]